jgi:hypothetical protein
MGSFHAICSQCQASQRNFFRQAKNVGTCQLRLSMYDNVDFYAAVDSQILVKPNVLRLLLDLLLP